MGIALGVIGLAAAPFSRKSVRRETLASRGRYILPAVVLGFVSSPACVAATWLDGRFVPDGAWVGVLCAAVTAAGIGLALGRNWSGTVTVKQDHELVQRGPYRLTRHPIYTGAAFALAGTALAFGPMRGGLVLPFAIFILSLKTKVEEELMTEQFGDAYASYRQRVKGLVPFVW